MELINGINRWAGVDGRPLFLALGNFDGVHRGHQTIIQSAVDKAKAAHGCSAALIFDPHPSILLRPDRSFALLTDIADRAELMAGLSLDYLIVEPFTDDLASVSPERFIEDILIDQFKVCGVVIGYDYSFGRGGRGNSQIMARWGHQMNFSVDICPLVQLNQKIVSSSTIRSLMLTGDVDEAAELLNYFFFRRGRVIKGSGIGKKLIFPTANINILPHLIQPGKGVYLTAVRGSDNPGLSFGVTHVGERPTFSCEQASVETYILDYVGDLYHREICLYFLVKLRETRAFTTPQLLKEQVARDIQRSRELIEKRYKNLLGDIRFENKLPGPGCMLKELRVKG
jgi:riboflavin kinase / FMN adenylyltransferase